jgi:LysM repeat protein
MNAARALLRRLGAPGLAVLLAVAVTASATGYAHYRVRPGDTLSEIATRYHTTVAALVRLNHLPGNGNLIYAGSVLQIPGHASTARPGFRTVTTIYVVRPGDSLYAIAGRLHASASRIARVNHLPSSLMVVIGQHLRIQHRVRVPVTRTGEAHGDRYAGFRGVYIPSRTAVVGMIRATAARWGVDQRLALGVSYEEAGFNQRVVSSVGAVGAMQIMPGTGAWVATYVVHRRLNTYRAQDNITAGVALLSVLLRETHGNARIAVAGYYQGLSSVRDRGMYRDTKQYVANVLALRNRF